ncbi:putative sporulation protein YtxC [Paenibacillus agricola]|uniref:Sporulation protein YtxC n=1 Tax=Paenibacillus agricola TaxID=2716264 RepID=A0ABX0IZ35_9BACL|nr:putative sporulation protein YtxC [Paenibacillus agricola]NHN29234.1 putative sporulation protein YtxC [Paenibacillus agricola]
MKLFAFTLIETSHTSMEQLAHELTTEIKNKYMADATVELKGYEGFTVIEGTGRQSRFSVNLQADVFYQFLAGVVADWVIAEVEEQRLRHLIIHEFHYEKEEDIGCILSYFQGEINEDNSEALEMLQRRKCKISTALCQLLKANPDLNIDGFIKFRLNEYTEELREVIEYAVDEFLMDRQYKEFISLLQYFVYIQEAKVPFVHLLHKGGNEFMLLDDKMEPVDTSESNTTLTMELLEKDINFEDVIVSTLISVSPKLIYIHTREPSLQIIQTISQIFENRVELCTYCFLCHNLDRSAVSDYNEV